MLNFFKFNCALSNDGASIVYNININVCSYSGSKHDIKQEQFGSQFELIQTILFIRLLGFFLARHRGDATGFPLGFARDFVAVVFCFERLFLQQLRSAAVFVAHDLAHVHGEPGHGDAAHGGGDA